MKALRLPRFDPYGLIIFAAGVLVLIGSLVRHLPERLEAILYFVPEGTARRVLFVLGLLLLYMSEQVAWRKKNAWRLTVALLIGLIIFSLARRFEPVQILTYCAVLALFLSARRKFVVENDLTSFRRSLVTATLQLIGAFTVIGIIFVLLDQREFGRHLTTLQTLRVTADALFGNPLPYSLDPTRYDRVLIDLLRLTVITSFVLLLINLFRPLRFRAHTSRLARMHAQTILEAHGQDSEDFFKLYPEDKHYFFYGESFVPYTVKNGVALVLDGASGKSVDLHHVRPAFAEYCRINGWRIAVIHCSGNEASAWEPWGIETLQIGSEAILETEAFLEKTIRNKHFRYVTNRARKDDLSVTWWQPPLSDPQIASLKNISDGWIASGRQEYSFVMAPFTAAYLRTCQVAVLTSGKTPIAYVNVLPTYGPPDTASIDHMRSVPDTSSVAMHYLFAEIIRHVHTQGFTRFNLGFVPLAKLETDSLKLTNRLLTVLRRVGSRFYSSAGLEQFKGKFEPQWSPRFLAYQGGIRQLPLTANAIRQAIAYKDTAYTAGRSHIVPIVLIALAGLCYASFPFAWFLNRPYAFHGLTSALGGEGQPYAWLFNISDIVSGALTIAILSWLRFRRRPHQSSLLRLTLDLALVSSLCTAFAALVPMPHQFASLDGQLKLSLLRDPVIVLHGLISFINSAAFVAAAVLWAIYWRRRDGHLWRRLFTALVIFLSTVGFVIGQVIPGLADTIQRSFITMYAVWFVLFVVDILTVHQRSTDPQ